MPGGGAPLVRDVVLVGGGHSHALLIRRWAMRPLAGVRLTLVSRDVLTPYSGMLPGLVAGHYTADEVHVDLLRLCAWAGVRFVRAEMSALDLERGEIRFGDASSRPPIGWDLLSLDTGSTPDLSVPGRARVRHAGQAGVGLSRALAGTARPDECGTGGRRERSGRRGGPR